ncbi:hypothetical protein GCM10007385_18190 [Tateyamaria omphalii]|uniref:hypothetical protein n=1 Tax=Tateyamaria omphalii TaxID=299262 RepID=UPI00199D1344|nr:hypothetical protein [Tateyamaria omphalii]GGX50169.1 hypothetical protein GCM10007385_18190 [Tateyamaria omphalii]
MKSASANTVSKTDTVTLRDKPSPNMIASFKDHVRKTGQPETYSLITTKQAFDLDNAEILAEFQVDRKKREDLRAVPCPICSPTSPKYLAGYLVWFPQERVIRAIGRECGKRINEKWDREQYAFKKRQQQEAREEYLEANLHLLPNLLLDYSAELARADAQETVWLAMRRENPAIAQYLRSGMRSGYLSVSERLNSRSGIAMTTSAGASKFREVRIGFCVGQSFVASKNELAKKLKQQLEMLSLFDFGNEPNRCFLAICDMTTAEMEKAERAIKRSKVVLDQARSRLDDFESFFSSQNIDLINQWAGHPSSELNFQLEIANNGNRFKVRSHEFGYTEIDLTTISLTQ